MCINHSTNSNFYPYEKWLNTLRYGHTMEYYAAGNKSTATQNMEKLHPSDVEQKKPREKTVYSD